MKNKIPASVLISVVAFAVGFWISHSLAEQRIRDFAKRIRLNEVHFVAVDAESGERICPTIGYSSKGMFGSVTLPGVMRWDSAGGFQMTWVDIEGMEGYIEPRAGGDGYNTVFLKEYASTTPISSGGAFLEPVEIRLQKSEAQQTSDGNSERLAPLFVPSLHVGRMNE